MYVISALIILAAIVVGISLLRLRLRFEIGPDRRLLFVGLGRSGAQSDYTNRVRSVKLFGIAVSTKPIEKRPPEEKAPGTPEEKKVPKATEGASKRERSIKDLLKLAPRCIKPLWSYQAGLLKSVIIEQLEAEVEAGFDSPDITGMAYGWYQASLAAVPAVVGRLRYTPDWTGASFRGNARVAVALPLYRLIFRSMQLLWRLPLREIIKVAIGKKKGGQDG